MIKAAILGATGYAGQELMRILHSHKEVEVTKVVSESYKDKNYDYIYRSFTGFIQNLCEGLNLSEIAQEVDVIFSALPYGVLSEHLTEEILDSVKIIDLGVDYRFMQAEDYRKYYGKEHKTIHLSSRFTYGLSEWNEEDIKKAEHIANPGCFATAIELSLLPLIKENVVKDSIITDGKCALSGSGRTLTIGTHFVEANESAKPYKIFSHPHKAECCDAIKYLTGQAIDLTFVPHIVPMQRGILTSSYMKLKDVGQDIREIYHEYYRDKQFVEILQEDMYVETKWVRNSNMCHINFKVDEEGENLVVFAALDNLIKGAAGQAVQNFNIMYGFSQNYGLDLIPSCI